MGTLRDSLEEAKETCWNNLAPGDLEEHGGVILKYKDTDDYKFIYLNNANSGKPHAEVLFTADRKEHGAKVISQFRDGWRHYASYHTHPQFDPYPSHTDLNYLFTGFGINYIYGGPTGVTMKYTWADPNDMNCGCLPEIVKNE